METNGLKLLKDHVRTQCRNGRRYYNPEAKQALIDQAALPGAAIGALAREHGISAGLLRRWVELYRNPCGTRQPAPATPQSHPFVPVSLAAADSQPTPKSLTARLPNGIEIELAQSDGATLTSLLEVLWRLPCSASTRT